MWLATIRFGWYLQQMLWNRKRSYFRPITHSYKTAIACQNTDFGVLTILGCYKHGDDPDKRCYEIWRALCYFGVRCQNHIQLHQLELNADRVASIYSNSSLRADSLVWNGWASEVHRHNRGFARLGTGPSAVECYIMECLHFPYNYRLYGLLGTTAREYGGIRDENSENGVILVGKGGATTSSMSDNWG